MALMKISKFHVSRLLKLSKAAIVRTKSQRSREVSFENHGMAEKGLLRQYTRAALRIAQGLVEVFVHWLFSLVYGAPGKSMPPIRDLILLDSATTIAYKIRTRKVSSLQVVNSFIDRIEEINPILNCVVAKRYDEARKDAQKADDLIKSGAIPEEVLEKEKPFLGVPFTTKDCIAVKDMIQTSGLHRRRDVIATEDADAVALLRKAGAIPLALTNISELCMWWESANTVHGRTNNPYNTNHIVGGSSGGEGCNQGAAGSAFGIGSDIGGSIRMPAFFNGVFGHKPSKNIVSSKGQYPIPVTQEQNSFLGIGPLCRRAEDLQPILKVIADKNAEKLKLDEKVDLKTLKFYYQESDGGGHLISPVNTEIRELFKKIVVHFEKAHKIKVKRVEIKRFQKSASMWLANMKAESGPTFQEQLANLNGSINLPLELVKWFLRLSHHTFIALATAIMEKAGVKYGSEKHSYLVQERDNLRRELKDILGDDGVFFYPTHPTPAPYHNEPLFKAFNFSYTGVINVLSFPATHIPMGLNKNGLPIGVQVFSNDNNDRYCLAVARELEKAFGGWAPPKIEV